MKRLSINEETLLGLLAAHPEGLSAAALRAGLRRVSGVEVSQPTLSRRLMQLRTRGQVVKTGAGPATKYLLAGGRKRVAELRSLAMHRAVAEKLVRDPETREAALARLEILRELHPESGRYYQRWEQLLQGDTITLLRSMTEAGETADTLRKASPFTTLLSNQERTRIFRQFSTGGRESWTTPT